MNIDSTFNLGHLTLVGNVPWTTDEERGLKFFTASDGARIAFRDEGQGRPLVLLHGLMAHGAFFREQADLAASFRLIRIDFRGHGSSARAGEQPNVETLARDVAELCESLDLEDAIGIGWSLGATVLWHVLTGPAAARFSGAVVVDMTARVLNGEDWALGLSPEICEARSAAIRGDFDTFARNAGQAIFAQRADQQGHPLADWASDEFSRNDPQAIASLWTSLVRQDVRALLVRITHPTLVVHGAKSSLYGDDNADHLVDALPNARAVRFDRSGHAPHLEQPSLFNQILKDFADRLSCDRINAITQTQ